MTNGAADDIVDPDAELLTLRCSGDLGQPMRFLTDDQVLFAHDTEENTTCLWNCKQKSGKSRKLFCGGDNPVVNWNERIEKLVNDRGLNRSAVERKAGLGKNRLGRMINGHEPSVLDAIRLCDFFGMPVEELFAGRSARPRYEKKTESGRAWLGHSIRRGAWRGRQSLTLVGRAAMLGPEDFKGQRGFVPILAPVAAGIPREAHDQGFPVGAAEAYIQHKCDDANAFALRVDGDSMMPDFRHGDIIIVSPKLGKDNDTYRDGMAAVIVFGSERTATFKLVRFENTRGRREHVDYILEPINRHHPKMRLHRGEIAAIHPVIGLARLEP